jgi:hypothetical protein
VLKLTTYSYRIAQWRRWQCQAHMFSIKHRRNNQPGNVKLRRARAIVKHRWPGAQVHQAFICNKPWLCTLFVKHRRQQPFQRQA